RPRGPLAFRPAGLLLLRAKVALALRARRLLALDLACALRGRRRVAPLARLVALRLPAAPIAFALDLPSLAGARAVVAPAHLGPEHRHGVALHARALGALDVADAQARHRAARHARHPRVVEGAVLPEALRTLHLAPQRHAAQEVVVAVAPDDHGAHVGLDEAAAVDEHPTASIVRVEPLEAGRREGRPADVAVVAAPAHPGGRPLEAGDPEPAAVVVPQPVAIVLGGPAPLVLFDPQPSVLVRED